MPPSDQEPRYQLVDSNGNVVGSLFGDGSGNVVIADETDTQTTFGPDGISTPSLEAESLVVGGTLYQEDGNSPINVAGTTSLTYTLDDPTDHIIIIPETTTVGFGALQVNGDTGANYDYVDNADTVTTGETDWDIPQFPENSESLSIMSRRTNGIKFRAKPNRAQSGLVIYGGNTNVTSPITQFTFIGSQNRDLKARVYRREMNI